MCVCMWLPITSRSPLLFIMDITLSHVYTGLLCTEGQWEFSKCTSAKAEWQPRVHSGSLNERAENHEEKRSYANFLLRRPWDQTRSKASVYIKEYREREMHYTPSDNFLLTAVVSNRIIMYIKQISRICCSRGQVGDVKWNKVIYFT